MPTQRLTAAIVSSSVRYDTYLAPEVTVGDIARYLSRIEGASEATTLEVARPVDPTRQLQDVRLQTGDRLALFVGASERGELPPAVYPGDKLLKVSLGDSPIHSSGKKYLLAGKPDPVRNLSPDIDLRHFIAAPALSYISRACFWLQFDDAAGMWFIGRAGQTRIVIGEFELQDEPVPLDADHWLRFYRASDDPRSPSNPPLGMLQIHVEEVCEGEEFDGFRAGTLPVTLCLGVERHNHMLNASANLPVDQIVAALARYDHLELSDDYNLCLLRLLAPDTALSALEFTTGDFLYARRRARTTSVEVTALGDV